MADATVRGGEWGRCLPQGDWKFRTIVQNSDCRKNSVEWEGKLLFSNKCTSLTQKLNVGYQSTNSESLGVAMVGSGREPFSMAGGKYKTMYKTMSINNTRFGHNCHKIT